MPDKIIVLEQKVTSAIGEKQKIDAMITLAIELRHSDNERTSDLSRQICDLSKSGEFEHEHYIFGLANGTQIIGMLNYSIGKYHLGLSQSEQALLLFEEIDDYDGQLRSNFAIGGCHYSLGNLTDALECQLKSLKIRDALGDSVGKATLLENIGILYAQLGLFEEALHSMEQSLEYIDEQSDIEVKPTTYNNLAMTHCKLGNFDLALGFCQKSLALSKQASHELGELAALDSMGCIYLANNDLENALPFFEEVVERSWRGGFKSQEMETLLNIGQLHCQSGQAETAIRHLKRARVLGKEMDAKTMLMDCYLALSTAYEEMKNFEEAYQYLQANQTLHAEIYDKEVQSKLSGLLVSHDIEAARKEAELNRSKNMALELEITERKKAEEKQEELIVQLREALTKVKQLSGLLPICASCKDIRDEDGGWHKVEAYLDQRSEAQFSHGICPQCVEKLYPELDI